ncbi:MICOS complex subunit Mic60 isoform X2 [Teleopsis dalmanni]|uniref:MICOS complex subunit Mic60 isoform X2 n=1 Tax=Teleopsis dalmanni TaxID=139649 RepID=UPI0018CD4D44|nr:MICOS complex subunit Mic60 isoform X2 [Teleopsis dalmanni]
MYRVALRRSCQTVLQKTQQQQARRHLSNDLPPNVRQAGFGKVILILSPFVVIGGTITYANYDKDFRKKLEEKVPGSEYIIKVALKEENPFKSINNKIDSISNSVSNATSTVTGFFSSSKKDAPKQTDEIKQKVEVTKTAAPIQKTTTAEEKKLTVPAPEKIIPKPVEKLPDDIIELEKAVEVAASLAVKEYNKAISILKIFNEDVRNIVDQAINQVDPTLWNTLRNKTSARDTAVEYAEKLAREAVEKIEKCEIALGKAIDTENQDQILIVRNRVKTFMDHINSVKDELYKTKDVATMSEKYWKSVEKARNYFINEIESLFPGLNLAEKKLNLSKEDLDLFLMHAYSHVLAYQKELQRLQTDGEVRLKRAIEAFRGNDASEAVKAQLEYQLELEKRKLALENQKKIFQIRSESERQLRNHLKQQAEAHIDHLKDALALREKELKRNYSRELEDKLASERANYKLQLAAMMGKMRGMDSALQLRADSERATHQAQALWAACQALWSTVKTGEPGVHWKTKLRPLKNEIRAISKVAEGDELVACVIQNLPREAEERGVFPEDALRERFINVEKVARKVALVPESGGGLPTYFLSYLQSFLILTPDDPISQDELENKIFDYSKLDTYDILNRARYFVDRGNLLQALKYMNLLQGASRKIASDWMKEVQLLLETQQAANTLMAHAAASGYLYL